MNVFYIDTDPRVAAHYHYDVHVRKMILETAQLLSTAQRIYLPRSFCDDTLGIYKRAFERHPCTVWVSKNSANYNWAFTLFSELLNEFKKMTGRCHSSATLYDALKKTPYEHAKENSLSVNSFLSSFNKVKTEITPPPLAMPIKYYRTANNEIANRLGEADPLMSYRCYYRYGKASLQSYSRNRTCQAVGPSWLFDDTPSNIYTVTAI